MGLLASCDISLTHNWSKCIPMIWLEAESFGETGKKSDNRTMEAIGELKGIRFALASEIDSARRFDEALIKKLTGGDTLRGTALRSSAFQFSPEFKIWLLTNHLPFARDGSHGF